MTRSRSPGRSAVTWIAVLLSAAAVACLTPGQARSLDEQVREIGRQVDRVRVEQERELETVRALASAAASIPWPAGSEKLYREGYALFHRGHYAESERALGSFLEADPESAQAGEARVLIGRSLMARGLCREAIEELSQALQGAPPTETAAQALYTIALCHLRLGETSQGRRALREIVGSYPTSDVAPLALARLKGL